MAASVAASLTASMTASADCERRDDGLLEQDLNAWSSLTYAAGGAIVAWALFRRRLPPAAAALAALLVAEGLGSWLFHGTGGDLAQFLHDVALIGALAFVAGWHAGRLVGAADRGSLIGAGVGLLAASTLFVIARDATNLTVAVTIVVIVAASIVAWRRGLTAVWSVPLLAVSALAVTAWVLGRSDSALCDPDSWLQPHALWHLLTAVVAVGWVDHSYAADDPTRAPRLFRRFTDRTIGLLAVGLVLMFHRSVDVVWRDRLPTDRPVLIVANHGNGFVDPVVVASVLGRLPRFLAKAALWKVVVARPFLGIAGVLPVYRSGDGDHSSDNASVFDACHQELAQGATVAIFPEGTTGDRAGLDRVKSGAARIALGALPSAPDLVIIPIGLAFESKVETRSRVAVMFGEPIVVATVVDHGLVDHGLVGHGLVGHGLGNHRVDPSEPDRDDVRALTERITDSLQTVSPVFADVEEREILRAAAGVERIDQAAGRRVSFAEREVVARRLATCDDDTRRQIVDAYRVFATRLELVGITEEQLRPERVGFGRLVVSAIGLFIAWSAVVAATIVHLPAVAVIVAGTGFVRSTATKGTVRLLLGLITIPATWIVVGVLVGDGWGALAAGLSLAVAGAGALVVWPPLVRQVVILAGRLRIRDRVGLLPPILEARSHLVALVAANIGGDHD